MIVQSSSPKNIEDMFNQVCHSYLLNLYNQIQSIDSNVVNFENIKNKFESLFSSNQDYDETFNYGNSYTDILSDLQLYINYWVEKTDLHNFIITIYENNNQGLEIAHKWIAEAATAKEIKKKVEKEKKDIKNQIKRAKATGHSVVFNQFSPINSESPESKLNSVIGRYFLPMLTTSIPNQKTFKYGRNSSKIEIRHGTQIEVIDGEVVINALYLAYIKAKKAKFHEKIYPVIYFNLLKKTDEHDKDNVERNKEGSFTEQLHKMESNNLGIAVITFPADEGFLDKNEINRKEELSYDSQKKKILNISLNNGKDFFISENIKKELFGTKKEEYFILNHLLDKSAKFLGLNNKKTISPAERQALMFHFIKYELTNFIIEKLGPDSFNFSCKDAIDRGAVHSLYYNTIKSIELNNPISCDEFKINKDGAAVEVKGRCINFHEKILANVFNVKINNQRNTSDIKLPEHIMSWSKKFESKHTYSSNIFTIFIKTIKSFFKNKFFNIMKNIRNLNSLSKEVYGSLILKKEKKGIVDDKNISIKDNNDVSITLDYAPKTTPSLVCVSYNGGVEPFTPPSKNISNQSNATYDPPVHGM
tara:strand:+ start:15777 stop:17543 length:1767 start_codon:yes stop_codon:yes gene_type:complete